MFDIAYERALFAKGAIRLAGIDEAGRGPLAGPVVAACVILDNKVKIPELLLAGVRDSKLLSAKKRNELYQVIFDNFPVGIGLCDQSTIDRVNILQATFLAMKTAVGNCKEKPDHILVDGNLPIPNCSYRQNAVVNGDALVFTIAMASIIAKVYRDRLMAEIDQQYPQYGFGKHKGYGTRFHLEQMSIHGLCPYHRRSFKPCAEVV